MMLPSGNDAAQCLCENLGKMLKLERGRQLGQPIKKSKIKKKKKLKLPDGVYGWGSKASQDGEQYFLREMNMHSKLLGMYSTNWANPHGLQNIRNLTTIEDMIKLCCEVWKDSHFRHICKTKKYLPIIERNGKPTSIEWENTNKLLFKNIDCVGMKTGITKQAGYCLASVFERDSKSILGIVLSCKFF